MGSAMPLSQGGGTLELPIFVLHGCNRAMHHLTQNDHVRLRKICGERRVSCDRLRLPSEGVEPGRFPILGFHLFMFTPFDVELPNSAW